MARTLSEEIEIFHNNGIHFQTRTIFIEGDEDEGGAITWRSARADLKNILAMDATGPNGDRPFKIIVNSLGGDLYSAMGLYDAIIACKNHVTVYVYGQASSAASVIMQAADSRVMSPHSRIMIHIGEDSLGGHPKVVKAWFKDAADLGDAMAKVYLGRIKQKKPRFTREQLTAILDHDTIYKAQEAIDMGLADKVLE
jgi:ATP-dependent Clp protease protease subunit